jgi:hypothetical protein
MISKAFDKAMEKLCALPDEEYVETMAQLMQRPPRPGASSHLRPEGPPARGQGHRHRANELLAKAAAPAMNEPTSKVGTILNKVVTGVSAMTAGTAMLTMSEETRPISGGFISATATWRSTAPLRPSSVCSGTTGRGSSSHPVRLRGSGLSEVIQDTDYLYLSTASRPWKTVC